MKHNFSIRDIVGALKTVRGVKNYYSDAQLAHLVDEAREVNAILDALPDPVPVADEWEQCEFDQIRKGDRVRLLQAGRTTDFHLPVIEVHPTHVVFTDNTQCSNYHNAKYHRIPADVQHPDPAKYFLIVDHDDDGSEYVASNGAYVSVYQLHVRVSPEEITNWSPAQIVPAGDA